MAAPQELQELIGRLKQVRSPLGRMKLLARGWKSLRRLNGAELRQLASHLGFEGADELVSKLARDGGRVDRKFLESLLKRARGADLEELSQAARDLRDPRKRARLLEKGLDFVVDELTDDEPAAAAPPPPEAERTLPLSDDPSPLTRLRRDAAAASKKVAATAVGAATAAGPGRRLRPAASTPPESAAPPSARKPPPETPSPGPTPPEKPARPSTAAARSRPVPPTAPPGPVAPPASSRAPAARRGASLPPPSARPAAARSPLAARLREARGAVERLRLLRDALEALRGTDVEGLRDLMTAFPEGWQRRRALMALLQHRIPNDLHEAVFLIEMLDSPQAARWCVTTILDRWELSTHEREALIERHGLSPVRARRLRRSAGTVVTGEAGG